MKNWKNIILVLLFLLAIIFGFWLIREKFPKERVRVEIRENEQKIDSLMFIIRENSLVIDSLKRQKEKVKERVVVRIKEVKELPPDSTVDLFYENLQEYGEVESEAPILNEDSTVTCSLDNLRAANVITAKYEGVVEENEILKEIVVLDSGIISNKDSIIHEKSIILNKVTDAYDLELTDLRKQLKSETRKKKVAIYSSAVLAGVIGSLLIFVK